MTSEKMIKVTNKRGSHLEEKQERRNYPLVRFNTKAERAMGGEIGGGEEEKEKGLGKRRIGECLGIYG